MKLRWKNRGRDRAQRLVRGAPDPGAALREYYAAEAEFRRQRRLPGNTVICGQDSDPGRLGRAARNLKRLGLR